MTQDRADDFWPELPGMEGAFDEQLALPLPETAVRFPVRTVVKRDGRAEPFDKKKIADAIFKAAQSIGGEDRELAESLAAAVAIYLNKRFPSASPAVDQIHDAVERVLMHMGHARTSLAYARYRDRRARIRRLREGDMRALLGELEEARHERDALGGAAARLLSVRTSDDLEARWDSERIVEALVGETGIERPIAVLVAREVEQQIEHAGLKTITASLIRELVGAKLIEHGLEEHRERHRRLGVPLYDCEHIVRGATPETVGRDPIATDTELARAVKKEYALARVFSPHAAEAHLRGEVHLCHLPLVDRLDGAVHTPAFIARHGVGLPGRPDFAAPPKHASVFLAQLVQCTELFQGFFAGPAVWEAVNICFAPFLAGAPTGELRQFAQMLVLEFAYRALAHGGSAAPPELGLYWTLPEEAAACEAIGPEGKGLGRPYAAFAETARQLAWEIVDAVRSGAVFHAPLLRIHLNEALFRADGADEFLEHAAAAGARGNLVHFLFDRDADPAPAMLSWTPWEIALQTAVLNLPSAAFEAGSEPRLYAELDRRLDVAMHAHREKRDFIESLLDERGHAPLSLLAIAREQGKPYVDIEHAAAHIAVDGLRECVHALAAASPARNEDARALAERILAHLRKQCARHTAKTGMPVRLAQNNDSGISRRFATLDATRYPKTVNTVLLEHKDGELRYTTGVRLGDTAGLSPIETARIEGGFHALLDTGAATELTLPHRDPSQEALSAFLRKVCRQTKNRRIVFGES